MWKIKYQVQYLGQYFQKCLNSDDTLPVASSI